MGTGNTPMLDHNKPACNPMNHPCITFSSMLVNRAAFNMTFLVKVHFYGCESESPKRVAVYLSFNVPSIFNSTPKPLQHIFHACILQKCRCDLRGSLYKRLQYRTQCSITLFNHIRLDRTLQNCSDPRYCQTTETINALVDTRGVQSNCVTTSILQSRQIVLFFNFRHLHLCWASLAFQDFQKAQRSNENNKKIPTTITYQYTTFPRCVQRRDKKPSTVLSGTSSQVKPPLFLQRCLRLGII